MKPNIFYMHCSILLLLFSSLFMGCNVNNSSSSTDKVSIEEFQLRRVDSINYIFVYEQDTITILGAKLGHASLGLSDSLFLKYTQGEDELTIRFDTSALSFKSVFISQDYLYQCGRYLDTFQLQRWDTIDFRNLDTILNSRNYLISKFDCLDEESSGLSFRVQLNKKPTELQVCGKNGLIINFAIPYIVESINYDGGYDRVIVNCLKDSDNISTDFLLLSKKKNGIWTLE